MVHHNLTNDAQQNYKPIQMVPLTGLRTKWMMMMTPTINQDYGSDNESSSDDSDTDSDQEIPSEIVGQDIPPIANQAGGVTGQWVAHCAQLKPRFPPGLNGAGCRSCASLHGRSRRGLGMGKSSVFILINMML